MPRRNSTYKRYLYVGSSASVPKRTLARRRAEARKRQAQRAVDPQQGVVPVEEGPLLQQEPQSEESNADVTTAADHSCEVGNSAGGNDEIDDGAVSGCSSASIVRRTEDWSGSDENHSIPSEQDALEDDALGEHQGNVAAEESSFDIEMEAEQLESAPNSDIENVSYKSSDRASHSGDSDRSLDDDDQPHPQSDEEEEEQEWDFMAPQAEFEEEPEVTHHEDEDQDRDRLSQIACDLHFNRHDDNTDDPCHGISIENLCRALLILATKMRHNLTYSATEDIVKLAGLLGDTNVPQGTKYFWKKLVHKFSSGMSVHHVCGTCSKYVGVAKNTEDEPNNFQELMCTFCNELIDPKQNVKSGNVFMYFSLGEQIKSIIEGCGDPCNYEETRQKKNNFAIEDIFDGDFYRENVEQGMLSVVFSVDGVPVFKSSDFKIYPIMCTLNNLPPKKRAEYIMLCGLWFGTGKPKDLNAYLTPFVAESRVLYEEGVRVVLNGVETVKRVKVLMGVSDSVQRPVLRCSTQFNGKYGCGLCLHPGIKVPKGRGSARVFPIKDLRGRLIDTPRRTHAETLRHTVSKEFGIKGRSILFDIPGFNVIECLDMDWPHAVLYGVVRQLAKCWFSSEYHDRNFSLRDKLSEVDKFLLSIKPSLEVSRTPRKMSDCKHWKMHEWAIWLLFYSLPTLKLFVNDRRYLHHWALLVEGISILSKRSIMRSEVEYAEECLLTFVRDFPDLYGVEEVSFNVHLVTHLPQSVKNFGCLWTHSSFIYEDSYQDLLSFVKSSQGVPIQICDSMRMRWVVKQLLKLCNNHLKEREKAYLETVLSRKLRADPSVSAFGASLLGEPMPNVLQDEEFMALQRNNVEVQRGTSVYKFNRAVIGTEVIHSKQYSRVSKRNSFVVLLKDENVFEIETFLMKDIIAPQECFAVGRYFQRRNQPFIHDRKLTHLITLNSASDQQMAAVDVRNILEKVTYLEIPHTSYSLACIHPNHVELLA